MSKIAKKEPLLPLQNFFAETLRDILENGTVKAAEISKATGIPAPFLSEMKSGRRRITAENDLRLSRYLGIAPGFFLRLQLKYELEKAERENASVLDAIVPVVAGVIKDAPLKKSKEQSPKRRAKQQSLADAIVEHLKENFPTRDRKIRASAKEKVS